jgi:transcription elongation factor Elf1
VSSWRSRVKRESHIGALRDQVAATKSLLKQASRMNNSQWQILAIGYRLFGPSASLILQQDRATLFATIRPMSDALSTSKPLDSPDTIESSGLQLTERDIVFSCPHCQGELVVDKEGAGLALACSHCGQTVTVPQYSGPSLHFLQAATSKLADALENARSSGPRNFQFEGQGQSELVAHQGELERQIRETQAQVSDLREQINHARIQLHRYQLKLEMLKEREAELKAEIEAVRKELSAPVNQLTETE